jgi:hypothetical protein
VSILSITPFSDVDPRMSRRRQGRSTSRTPERSSSSWRPWDRFYETSFGRYFFGYIFIFHFLTKFHPKTRSKVYLIITINCLVFYQRYLNAL